MTKLPETMLARVAIAMVSKSKARIAGLSLLNSVDVEGEEDFVALARSALMEMRDPDNDAVDKVAEALTMSASDLRHAFQLIIDEALKQE